MSSGKSPLGAGELLKDFHYSAVAIDLDYLAGLDYLRCIAYIGDSRDTKLAGDNGSVGKQTALVHHYRGGWQVRVTLRHSEGTILAFELVLDPQITPIYFLTV